MALVSPISVVQAQTACGNCNLCQSHDDQATSICPNASSFLAAEDLTDPENLLRRPRTADAVVTGLIKYVVDPAPHLRNLVRSAEKLQVLEDWLREDGSKSITDDLNQRAYTARRSGHQEDRADAHTTLNINCHPSDGSCTSQFVRLSLPGMLVQGENDKNEWVERPWSDMDTLGEGGGSEIE